MSGSNKSSSINKKLTFPLNQQRNLGLFNKKIVQNNFNNNNSNNNYNFNIQNLIRKTQNKKKDLFSKVIEQITKDYPNNIMTNNRNIEISKSQSIPSSYKSSHQDEKKIHENYIENEEKSDKKESNEDEDDILSEQKDKIEENDNEIININKVESMNIHTNFISRHNNTGSNLSHHSNTSYSNNSSNCNTEPNNNQNFWKNRVYHTYVKQIFPYKNSFISTDPNSFNQSGHKIDSSSSESGQYSSMQFNHTMTNFRNNNNYIFPFPTNVTPIGNKHNYTNSFNSKENLYNKKPALSIYNNNNNNINKKYFHSNTESNKNNVEKKEGKNIPINLKDVALGKDSRTTIMVKNIPIKYDYEALKEELKPFEGKYDCIYIPHDYAKKGNKGFAFVNLTSPYHILLFYDYFHNRGWRFYQSLKICDLYYAKFQGTEAILKQVKGNKGPIVIECPNDVNIEIPNKYINLLLNANPKMKYHENPFNNTFIVDSFK